ncbi:unnamed protein product [Choristocarpus tenellus]
MCRPSITSSTPFPWKPMLVISWALLSHSFALSSLFPYVGYMVQDIGIARSKDEAGFYAGYVASAFMLGRFLFSYFWGRFSDMHGRKPGLCIGLLAIAVFSLGFGVSQTFSWAIACRFLLGAMNGIVGISKTMISEICGREHEVEGMGFITTSWSIGMVIGPGLGGLLARPAVNMPSLFSNTGLFARYPYLLANVVSAGMGLVGLPLIYFVLPETYFPDSSSISNSVKQLPTSNKSEGAHVEDKNSSIKVDTLSLDKEIRNESLVGDERKNLLPKYKSVDRERCPLSETVDYGSSNGRSEGKEGEGYRAGSVAMSEKRPWKWGSLGCKRNSTSSLTGGILSSPVTRWVIGIYGLLGLLACGFDEFFPLWALSSTHLGGLDWTTVEIGQVLSFCGIGMIVFQVLIYPQLMKLLGVVQAQCLALAIVAPIISLLPTLNYLQGTGLWQTVAAVALISSIKASLNIIFVAMALATNACVPTSQRGALNGLAMSIGSIGKASGPVLASTLFAWSIATDEGVQSSSHHSFPFDYHLVFYVLELGLVFVGVGVWLKVPIELINPSSNKDCVANKNNVVEECGDVEDGPVDRTAAA